MDDEWTTRFGARLRRNEPMSRHTTFGIGGPADVLVDVETPAELRDVLRHARETGVPVHVIGRGANVLVSDEGIRGIVLRLTGGFRTLDFDVASSTVEAGAGVPLGLLVDESCRRGFFDFCWAVGIPGTVGGAVVCNAGSWGHAIGRFVDEIRLVTPDGQDVILDGDVVDFGYRGTTMAVAGAVVTGVRLGLGRLASEGHDAGRLKAKYLSEKRRTQPLDVPSAGSVFKNPQGEAAGALIDRAGCKGLRAGGAVVSEKHANFIVNESGATATDVLELVEVVRERVGDRFGVELTLELRLL